MSLLVTARVFLGNPGTGKTTVASVISKVLHGFGLLATDHVEITSAMDMVGAFVGQTKDVVQKLMEAARGGVLLIDEAYEVRDGRVCRLLFVFDSTVRGTIRVRTCVFYCCCPAWRRQQLLQGGDDQAAVHADRA